MFKKRHYAYIPPYMHKTLPTLGGGKEQSKLKFMKNRRASQFSCGRLKPQNNLFHSSDWPRAQKVNLHQPLNVTYDQIRN